MSIEEPKGIIRYDRKMLGRKTFSCGVQSLDDYIKFNASQHEGQDLTRIFVALDENTHEIIGFYSLSALSVNPDSLDNSFTKGIRFSEIPAVLLGRLAVDNKYQSQGLGLRLMMHAFRNICNANEILATRLMVVDAIDESIVQFYEKFGFSRVEVDDLRLFLPFSQIRKIVQGIDMEKENL